MYITKRSKQKWFDLLYEAKIYYNNDIKNE